MDNIAAVLDYGLLGLVTIIIVGFFWYVRSIEARAAKREEAEQERQKEWLKAFGRSIEALVSSTATLAVIASKSEAHDARMQEEHKEIIQLCRENT